MNGTELKYDSNVQFDCNNFKIKTFLSPFSSGLMTFPLYISTLRRRFDHSAVRRADLRSISNEENRCSTPDFRVTSPGNEENRCSTPDFRVTSLGNEENRCSMTDFRSAAPDSRRIAAPRPISASHRPDSRRIAVRRTISAPHHQI